MNVLIVYAHPEPKYFNGGIKDFAVSILTEQGYAVCCLERLFAVAALIALAIAGKNLLPVAVISLVAIVCLSELFWDLYQSRRIY